MSRSHAIAYLLLVLVALFWAGNTIVGRAVHQELPPLGLAFWRSFGAFLIVAPFGARTIWRERSVIRSHWRLLTVLGILGMTGFSTLVFVGLRHTEAVNGSLIQGTLPVNIILVALVLTGRFVAPRQSFGVAIALVGLIAIVARGDPAVLANMTLNIGDPLIWIGVVCHATFSVLVVRRPEALDLMAFLTVCFFVGSVTTLPLYVWESATFQTMPLSVTAIWAVVFIAVFPSVLAQLFWVEAIHRVGATTSGYFIYLTPVFGTLMAVGLLGEALALFHVVGMVLIFAGVFLATTSRQSAQQTG